ncbi:MAG: SCO family protein [Flavobacteriales bacterium]|jgi:protein SCO1/2|nr:SCO family protein [Flavobacteriales bacterium]
MARIIAFLAIVLVAVVIGWRMLRPSDDLPVYHPRDINPRLVDAEVRDSPGEHRIMDFTLTDHLGNTYTRDSIRGRVLVTDFFFTTCPTICPRMTEQLGRVQAAFRSEPGLLLLSHSVTPEMDSVPVLAAHAAEKGVDPARWRLLTGPRKQIYALARRSYFACLDEGDGGLQDFVHTENFVLVDHLGRLRGFYDGTSPKDVDRLIADIPLLLAERNE